MLELVHQNQIKHYGVMVKLDRHIGYFSEKAWWMNTFKAIGVEVSLGQLYFPQCSGFRGRKNREYREEVALLMHKAKSQNGLKLVIAPRS